TWCSALPTRDSSCGTGRTRQGRPPLTCFVWSSNADQREEGVMPAIRRLMGMLLLAMAIAAQPRLVSAQQEGTNAESNCKYCDPCAQPGYVRADYCTACHNDKAGGPVT